MNKVVVIFGSDGLLGREFVDSLSTVEGIEIVLLNRMQCDISNNHDVEDKINKYQPDVVINCAGMIDIDQCERDPDTAYKINAMGPAIIARALKNNSKYCTFLQPSTCYVFGNEKSEYIESDTPDPLNVYGASKLAGEDYIQSELDESSVKFFIVRTSWLYSKYRDTFVDIVVNTLKRGEKYSVVTDQFNVITWAKDLTEGCKSLIFSDVISASGIYHVAANSERPVSKFEIASVCAGMCGLSQELLVPATSDVVFAHNRSASAFLKTTKHIKLPDWKESLSTYLRQKYE